MPTDVIMPALGLTQDTGKVLRWLKAAGQTVTKSEPLMEIETDKVTVEIEAPASGVLAGIAAAEGDVVPVGQVVAVILMPGESMSTSSAPTSLSSAPTRLQATSAAPAAGTRLPPASPKARRLASERGVDLSNITGTGPGGEVLTSDVLAASGTPTETVGVDPGAIWRVMADRLSKSWPTVPHFYLLREVSAARLVVRHERLRAQISELTYTDLLIALAASALRQHPQLNARWESGRIVYSAEIGVGLAVAVPDGLIVPVLQRADELSLTEIVHRRRDLVTRAQAARLGPDDLRGGTFTVSNLGMFDVDSFFAIVNPPQAAILGIGRITDRVVAVGGQPVVRPMLTLSLSCDHRAVDGARGAQFLDSLARMIESADNGATRD